LLIFFNLNIKIIFRIYNKTKTKIENIKVFLIIPFCIAVPNIITCPVTMGRITIFEK